MRPMFSVLACYFAFVLTHATGFQAWLISSSPTAYMINLTMQALLGGIMINMAMTWATKQSNKEMVAKLEKQVAGYDEEAFKI